MKLDSRADAARAARSSTAPIDANGDANGDASCDAGFGASGRRRGNALAIAALVFLLGIFFAEPIARYGTSYYSPADLTQSYSLSSVEPGHSPGNRFLSDPVVQMQPWLMFNRDSIRAGELPLWNPYNAGGVPHLANYQSAVFSPFSAPFYVLSFKAALLVSAFLKLFALALFTFLFLREIGLSAMGAMTGALVFTFSGQNVLLLSYPHTAANFALPAGLFFAERAIRRFLSVERASASSADSTGARFWPLVGLAVSMALGLLAGQPEPIYFCGAFIAVYTTLRLAWSWNVLGRTRAAAASVAKLGLGFALAALFALALAAAQLVPFCEYLQHSHVLEVRSSAQTPLSLRMWPLFVFPNLLGNPAAGFTFDDSIPPPDFETATMVYGSAAALLAALASIAFVRKTRWVALFLVLACTWLAYAYDFLGFARLIGKLPTLSIAPVNRSQAIWHACIACLAALGVHHLGASDTRRSWRRAALAFAIGAALLAVVSWRAERLADWVFDYVKFMKIPRERFDAFRLPHVAFVVWTTAAALAALALMWAVRSPTARRALALSFALVLFLQSGWLFRGYNPTTEERFFYPRTPSIEKLARRVGMDELAILADDTLPPASNMAYGIPLIASYDAMWNRTYDRLYRASFGESNNWRTPKWASIRALQLFGVDYVATKGPWLRVDTALARIPWNPAAFYPVGEILPGADVVQTFTAARDGLQAVVLFASTYGRTQHCTLEVELANSDGVPVAHRTIDGSALEEDAQGMAQFVLDFAPIEHSRAQSFTLRARSGDATAGENALTLWARRDYPHWEDELVFGISKQKPSALASDVEPLDPRLPRGTLERAGARLEGGLVFDHSYAFRAFERVEDLDPFVLYRLRTSPSRFHVVHGAQFAASDDGAFELVRAREFDPSREVVLLASECAPREHLDEPARAASADRSGDDHAPSEHVERLEERPTRVRVRAELDRPGYLVTASAWFPGWKVTVNGASRPLLRANYAFRGVELDAGESEIEFVYDPLSVRAGVWISGLALVIGLVLCVLQRRRRLALPRGA